MDFQRVLSISHRTLALTKVDKEWLCQGARKSCQVLDQQHASSNLSTGLDSANTTSFLEFSFTTTSSRPSWAAQWVLGQPGLQNKTPFLSPLWNLPTKSWVRNMVCLSFKALWRCFSSQTTPKASWNCFPVWHFLWRRGIHAGLKEGLSMPPLHMLGWEKDRPCLHRTCCYLCIKVTPIYHVTQHFKPKHSVDARAWFSAAFTLGRETLPFYTSLNALAFSSLLIHQHNLWSSRLTMTVKIWG